MIMIVAMESMSCLRVCIVHTFLPLVEIGICPYIAYDLMVAIHSLWMRLFIIFTMFANGVSFTNPSPNSLSKQQFQKALQNIGTCIVISFASFFTPTIPHAYAIPPALTSSTQITSVNSSGSIIQEWNLPNGEVKLQQVENIASFSLQDFELLGSGGGGAVFATTTRVNEINQKVALKVSWVRSANSVSNECKILNILQNQNTRHVEQCLANEPYPLDKRRVMILMQPVVENADARVDEVNETVRIKSVQGIIEAMVDILAANVVTSDVQPLINRESGQVLFIDMTEASIISNPPSFLDLAMVSSFCSEMITLIPEDLLDVASKVLRNELFKKEMLPEVRELVESLSIYTTI